MKTLKVIDNVYRVTIHFLVEKDGEKAKKYLAKVLDDDEILEMNFNEPIGAKSLWNSEKHKVYAIWIRHPQDIGHLVHESVHIARRVLGPRGIYLADCDEAYAYYIEFLFNNGMTLMKV